MNYFNTTLEKQKLKGKCEHILADVFCNLWLKQSHGRNCRRSPISATGRYRRRLRRPQRLSGNCRRSPISGTGRHRRRFRRSQRRSGQEIHLRRVEIRIFRHRYQPLSLLLLINQMFTFQIASLRNPDSYL